MKRTTWIVALCVAFDLTIPRLANAQHGDEPSATRTWDQISIPGTPDGLARAADLPPDRRTPEWLLCDVIRASVSPAMPGGSRVKRVATYVDAILRLNVALAELGQTDITIQLLDRKHSRFVEFVNSIGLTDARRAPRIRLDPDEEAASTRAILKSAGIDVEGAAEILNGGSSLKISIPHFTVLLPRLPAWWSKRVVGDTSRSGTPEGAGEAILGALAHDQRLAYLYYGLMSVDPTTRTYFEGPIQLVSKIHSDYAALFATYGSSIHIRNGRISVPGGSTSEPLWEKLIGQKVTAPDRFIESLFSTDSGRAAYFYHLVDNLDAPHQRFILNSRSSSNGSAHEWIDAVYKHWFFDSESHWRPEQQVFTRPLSDPSLFIAQIQVDDSGRPIGPMWQSLWRAAFSEGPISVRIERSSKSVDVAVDAGFLLERISSKSGIAAVDRIDSFLFAQRVFNNAGPTSTQDLTVAIRGFQRFRMLHLSLERMGITSPTIHADAARRANTISDIGNADTAVLSTFQFQGALSLIERATWTHRISADIATELVKSLTTVPLDRDGSYGAGLAVWLSNALIPAVSAAQSGTDDASVETRLLAGLAGLSTMPTDDAVRGPGPLIEWEGWRYRVDPSLALLKRFVAIRQRQNVNSTDQIAQLAHAVSVLSTKRTVLSDVTAQLPMIKRIRDELRDPKSARQLTDKKAIRIRDELDYVVDELSKIRTDKQLRNAERSARSLELVMPALTADLLRSLVYAIYIPDSRTALLSGGDVSYLHDVGLDAQSQRVREQVAWSLPQEQAEEKRFFIRGSMLGLDLALAELSLRYLAVGKPPDATHLSAMDRNGYIELVALFNPFDPRLAEMHVVADAVKRGRERVRRLAVDRSDVEAVATTVNASPFRRAYIEWVLEHAPESLVQQFSAAELLRLSGDVNASVAGIVWGGPATPLNGCLCTMLPLSIEWELFSGRDGALGTMAVQENDIGLRLAEIMDDLKLPPSIVADILPFAVRTTIEESQVTYVDDARALREAANALSERIVTDFIARVTDGHSLFPVEGVGR